MSFSFSSLLSAPRADASTNYVDWWQVKTSPCELINIFGYNSGPLQWVQIFDSNNGPTIAAVSDDLEDNFTFSNHGLSNGQRVRLTGYTGITNGTIGYVRYINSQMFEVYDTLAHAIDYTSLTGRLDSTAVNTGVVALIPMHSFGVAAADNYSCIIPVTALGLGKGLVVANSTTGAIYTGGAKNITILGSLR